MSSSQIVRTRRERRTIGSEQTDGSTAVGVHPIMGSKSVDLEATMAMAIDQELREVLAYRGTPEDDFRLMPFYHMGWEDAGQPAPLQGKRFRAMLTLLCCMGAGGMWERALPLAAGVELLHNFSLVHDDVQDASPLRRGRASVWKKWGEAHAINVGNALFAHAHLAVQRATKLPAETRLRAMELLDNAGVGMSKGQFLDIGFENREDVTVDEYMEMIDGKTARLTGCAAALGPVATGISPGESSNYFDFGRHLGLSYQIWDDIQGIWGDPGVIGKSRTSDLMSRKKTLPVIHGLERSKEFRDTFNKSGTLDVDFAARLLEQTGARSFAMSRLCHHVCSALEHLEEAGCEKLPKSLLRKLTLRILPGAEAA